MKTILFVIMIYQTLFAQDVLELWDGNPPYYKTNSLREYVKESWGVPCVHNVTKPELTVYPALGENCGRAMIICPGSGRPGCGIALLCERRSWIWSRTARRRDVALACGAG
ncbi:hypothetical protein JW935_27930 [candidate division KSB1 bacterium]|nr:hypothetical protein [candidate division KSB1 bacterium]